MKKFLYILAVLSIGALISYSMSQLYLPFFSEAIKNQETASMFSIFDLIWQFLLLGLVTGGVILRIPSEKHNKICLSLSGMLCVLGSLILIADVGFIVPAESNVWIGKIVYTVGQIGLTSVYIGIAIAIVELVKEAWRLLWTFIK
jgi:hypothetical protein